MKIIYKQSVHFLFLMVFLPLIFFLTKKDPYLIHGDLWTISTNKWFYFTLLIPILHQVYVLICWRLELYHNSISKTFGEKGFKLYKIGFAILILSRPISITLLAFSNAWTIGIPIELSYLFSFVLFVPAVYLFYSVKKYFGMDRAFGIDHFHPEKYKNVPFVKKGIFKYTSNGMYIFGFFILWIPGILLQSKAALLLAFFNHLYIWVHYYFTELPDIKTIYHNEDKGLPKYE